MSTTARPTEILGVLLDEDAVVSTRNIRDDRFFVMAGSRLPPTTGWSSLGRNGS